MNTPKNSSKIRPILLAVGAGVALGLAGLATAQAESGQFSSGQLKNGYNLAKNTNIGTETGTTAKCTGGKCSGKKCGKDGKCSTGKCSSGKCSGKK